MKYHNITKCDILNGEGVRVVLWVSGCSHRCPDCQNPITWNPNVGLEFAEEAKKEFFDAINNPDIDGVTFSGGDPLFEGNRDTILNLAQQIKQDFPDKNIWLYTGYTYEQISNLEILKYIDVLVDGRFDKNKKQTNLLWRGSSNQRVIDVKQTLKLGQITLYCE